MNDRDWLLKELTTPQIRSWVWKVWQRLPSQDRAMLRRRLRIVETANLPSYDTLPEGYLADTRLERIVPDPTSHRLISTNYEIRLKSETENEAVQTYAIAHELAHAILQHPDVRTGLAICPEYCEDQDVITRWMEEHADYVAWNWGFQDEFRAKYAAYPDPKPPRWYQAMIAVEQH